MLAPLDGNSIGSALKAKQRLSPRREVEVGTSTFEASPDFVGPRVMLGFLHYVYIKLPQNNL